MVFQSHVVAKRHHAGESLTARVTRERPLARVNHHVLQKFRLGGELLIADGALPVVEPEAAIDKRPGHGSVLLIQ